MRKANRFTNFSYLAAEAPSPSPPVFAVFSGAAVQLPDEHVHTLPICLDPGRALAALVHPSHSPVSYHDVGDCQTARCATGIREHIYCASAKGIASGVGDGVYCIETDRPMP